MNNLEIYYFIEFCELAKKYNDNIIVSKHKYGIEFICDDIYVLMGFVDYIERKLNLIFIGRYQKELDLNIYFIENFIIK